MIISKSLFCLIYIIFLEPMSMRWYRPGDSGRRKYGAEKMRIVYKLMPERTAIHETGRKMKKLWAG